ncbi:NADPH:quinone reductase, partial [Spongiactinospora gelatinilytica]
MRAIRFHEYGPAEVLRLEEVPDPVAGPGEVLVRVEAAGISHAETQIRAGLMPEVALPLPFTPGFEVAGTVVATGPDTDPEWTGGRVLAITPGGGGYAELAAIPAGSLRPLPTDLDSHAGLALLSSGVAAVGAFAAGEVGPGETVLVEAAAGG